MVGICAGGELCGYNFINFFLQRIIFMMAIFNMFIYLYMIRLELMSNELCIFLLNNI